MFLNCYSGKRVFITGHTGFKGSWLCAWLLGLGAEVTGFSMDIPTCPSCFEALELHTRMTDLRGDVRDASQLDTALQDARPDIIFHLAAQALVRESYLNPLATFTTNMLGTLNVLEGIRNSSTIKAGVIITSDKCYRNEEWLYGYREIDPLGGTDPYSASKGCAELISHSYFGSFFKDQPACATVRAGNVIGGGDWAKDRIVPDCVRAWHADIPVDIRSPHATRPWQHVLEPLSGYLWLGANLLEPSPTSNFAGQSYNFGPPADAIYPVAEVAKGLQLHWPGFQVNLAQADSHMKECGLLKLCCDKALAELAWKATWDFDETIRNTADWYARYKAEHTGMWAYTQGQIMAYCNAAVNRNLAWSN